MTELTPIPPMFYVIDGIWVDNQETFKGYLMCSDECTIDEDGEAFPPENPYYTDINIFYYGMSIEEAKASIGSEVGDGWAITKVYPDAYPRLISDVVDFLKENINV